MIKVPWLGMFLFGCISAFAQSNNEVLNFFFGNEDPVHQGSINAAIPYGDSLGHGFDFGTYYLATFNKEGFSTDRPTYYSVKLPEGDYKVTLALGSDYFDTKYTVKAESRRLLLDQVVLKTGERKDFEFIVNVRTPKIDEGTTIKIKEREVGYLNWDDKLTLEFLGKVNVRGISIQKAEPGTTIYLAGDSTVTDQDLEPWASWGQFLTAYVTSNVSVANYAASGESLHSFKSRLRLQKVLRLLKPGDYLFIEFGHNDQKRSGEGIGPYSSFSDLLREYVEKARGKGAMPILITPAERRHFNSDGSLQYTHGHYPDAMRKIVTELDVPLIDLNQITHTLYPAWGDDQSKKAFVHYVANTFPGQNQDLADDTHFNDFGAHEIALCIISDIIGQNLDLKKWLMPHLPKYDPTKPNLPENWTLPMSARFESVKPYGN